MPIGWRPACMPARSAMNGHPQGWREYAAAGAAWKQGVFTIKQDARLLNREVLPTLVGQSLPEVAAKHGLVAGEIDWFLPHYSSEYFQKTVVRGTWGKRLPHSRRALVHQSRPEGQYRLCLFLHHAGRAFFFRTAAQRTADTRLHPRKRKILRRLDVADRGLKGVCCR